MMTDKDSSAAGKPHGKLIWKSIQNGPTPHPQTTDPTPEGGAVPPLRNKTDEEFTEEDNRNELSDIQAINILSQGPPRHIFNILNQNETGREIWVNFELLMKGSGQTLERRKEALFDEFECFRANGNELIQDYFVCFHKLSMRWKKVGKVGVRKTKVVTRWGGGCFLAKGFYLMTKIDDGDACGDVIEVLG
nr:hypothetical protein [Tanacetum cinerariifolium]